MEIRKKEEIKRKKEKKKKSIRRQKSKTYNGYKWMIDRKGK